MVRVTETIAIDEAEVAYSFVSSSGPGGQNVNRVSTAVQLRFDAARSASLPEDVRQRLPSIAGKRMTTDGVIVIKAQRYRTQQRNREDALARLVDLLRRAADPPRPRRPTHPTHASKERRREQKVRRSQIKRLRSPSDVQDRASGVQ